MSSQKRPARTNVKDASASSLRKSMTQRRHRLTAQIRKNKKSQQIQLKRRHVSSASTLSTPISTSETHKAPDECFQQLIASPSIFTLSSLQTSLASSKQPSSLPLHDLPSQQADQFLHVLTGFLRINNEETCILHSLRILTNLAAMECPDSYYTSSTSWCSFILASDIPSGLAASLSSPKGESVLEQACWVIGNIAGDSQHCRDRLISLGFIPKLIASLRQCTTNASVKVRRNMYWALSNMARGNSTALPFIQGGLSSGDLLSELKRDVTDERLNEWDVRKELYCLITFLTGKEDEVADILLNDEVLTILSQHFSYVTNYTLEKRDRGALFQSVIPLIRIFGNLATMAGGKYVPGLIAVGTNTIVQTLATWLQVHKPCGETITIANEATWVIGALLCDVGYADHPSTTVACPILFPVLCNVLLVGTFTLEWKREVLNAIWNALAAPPGSAGEETLYTRDELLLRIYKTKGMIRALVGLCTCMDVDAIRPAVNIIDAFHRRIGRHDDSAARILEEAECLHALEHICDAASASASYGGGTDWSTAGHSGGMDYCAEMAANLIDDFYGDEEVDWDIGGSSKEFEFGVEESVPVFDFTDQNATTSTTHNSLKDPMLGQSSGRGRGRGRGRVVPSWMVNKV